MQFSLSHIQFSTVHLSTAQYKWYSSIVYSSVCMYSFFVHISNIILSLVQFSNLIYSLVQFIMHSLAHISSLIHSLVPVQQSNPQVRNKKSQYLNEFNNKKLRELKNQKKREIDECKSLKSKIS
jgi:hypothetical protein